MNWKTMVIVGCAAAFVNVTAWNMAYAKFDSCEQWGIGCEEPAPTNGNVTVENSNKNTNTNVNTNFNTNTNTNVNANVNVNSNKQSQDQDQDQVQLQGQGQDQKQEQTASASADNKGNVQSTNIKFEDKREYDHITPYVGKTNANMKNHADVNPAKVLADIDSFITSITLDSAKKLMEDCDDYDVYRALLFENDFKTVRLQKGASGDLMGIITIVPDGADVTLAGMQGVAYHEAMKAGATSYTMTVSDGLYLEGAKAGIDFGGAGSIAANEKGSAMLSPASTFGYSKSWSSNEYRPSVIITLYFDDTLEITTVNKTKAEYTKVRFIK